MYGGFFWVECWTWLVGRRVAGVGGLSAFEVGEAGGWGVGASRSQCGQGFAALRSITVL